MRATLGFLTLLALASSGSAQSEQLRFDVVAIKPLGPTGGPAPNVGEVFLQGGMFRDPGTNLRVLIDMAYDVDDLGLKIAGLPKWAESAGYAVTAKAGPDYPADISPNQNRLNIKAMLRSMLADRFQLRLHQEERPTKVLGLQVKTGRSKLTPVPAPVPPEREILEVGFSDRKGGFRGRKVPIAKFADTLTLLFKQPVVDRTGLTGFYDFDAKWETPVRDGEPTPANTFGPVGQAQVLSVLDQTLGLVLKSDTAPIKYWVVDHVEMPSEN